MKYYVLICGKKIFCSTKREAKKIMIDEFLNGTQNLDWNIYDSKKCVVCG
jgi:hypothetical protein